MRHQRITAGIEVVNTEQAAAWDGHEGDVWTEQADRYDRASRRHWQRFVEAQLVGVADHVVDIGCGTGGATRAVARIASGGAVTGIDLSTRMLELARTRSVEQGLDNVTFVRGDAQVFAFEPDAFDLAMSSFGAMFFNDPVAAFTNIAGGLRRDGALASDGLANTRGERLADVAAAGTRRRTRAARAATRRAHAVRARQPGAGSSHPRIGRLRRASSSSRSTSRSTSEPMPIDALEFAKSMGIVEGLLHALDDQDRATAMSNLADLFHAHATPDGVLFDSAAWLITARRS